MLITMKSKENQHQAHSIVDYYRSHNFDRQLTIHHFLDQNVNLRTIQRVLKRFTEDVRVDYKLSGGRPRSVLTDINKTKVRNKFIQQPNTSSYKVAEFLALPETTVRRAKKELGIVVGKKIKRPLYRQGQAERCKTNAWKLYNRSIGSER